MFPPNITTPSNSSSQLEHRDQLEFEGHSRLREEGQYHEVDVLCPMCGQLAMALLQGSTTELRDSDTFAECLGQSTLCFIKLHERIGDFPPRITKLSSSSTSTSMSSSSKILPSSASTSHNRSSPGMINKSQSSYHQSSKSSFLLADLQPGVETPRSVVRTTYGEPLTKDDVQIVSLSSFINHYHTSSEITLKNSDRIKKLEMENKESTEELESLRNLKIDKETLIQKLKEQNILISNQLEEAEKEMEFKINLVGEMQASLLMAKIKLEDLKAKNQEELLKFESVSEENLTRMELNVERLLMQMEGQLYKH